MMLKRMKIEREWLFAAFTAHLQNILAEYVCFFLVVVYSNYVQTLGKDQRKIK